MTEEKIYWIDKVTIDLRGFSCSGKVLDIGGGGEGVIGRILKDRVVAIDLLESELKEAPVGPLKIIMDAKELKFIDNTFDTVTAFFSLMYIHSEDHLIVFNEIYRVLKPGGKFILWDVSIPAHLPDGKEIFAIPLEIFLKDETVETGYGVKGKYQNIQYFKERGENAGFILLEEKKLANPTFSLQFLKQ